jgi:hypothetical protein
VPLITKESVGCIDFICSSVPFDAETRKKSSKGKVVYAKQINLGLPRFVNMERDPHWFTTRLTVAHPPQRYRCVN